MAQRGSIKVAKQHGSIVAISVNGENLDSDDGDIWFLPKGLIGETSVSDMPDGIGFQVCNSVENGVIQIDRIPIVLRRNGPNRVRADFEDSITRKYWDGRVGLKLLMDAKKAIVEELARRTSRQVKLGKYEDDGAWIHLAYSSILETGKLQTAVQLAEQLVIEIDGAAEMRVGAQIMTPHHDAQNEQEFTLGTVVPILRRIGFQNVRYNHGRREFGKDVLFARMTEFFELEHWGAQIKFGNVSGRAAGDIDTILAQIDDAFSVPFHDLYTKRQQYLSKVAIIISGEYTDNAVEKICNKIENPAERNNVVFIDGAKLKTLAEKFGDRRR